jgi:lysophospholipase L1-like esterase
MNDTDEKFKTYFDSVKGICDTYGITMIAALVPTTPSVNNEVKKQYVIDSGVRYIDFYSAVGANPSGNWYDGYLSNDNVHPTQLGAQALATQVLVDFPEIMEYRK